MGHLWREPKESFDSFKTKGIPFLLGGSKLKEYEKESSISEGMKRIPAGFLLEGFQIEGMAKGMNSLAHKLASLLPVTYPPSVVMA
jgi:hypothetical protein